LLKVEVEAEEAREEEVSGWQLERVTPFLIR
jgi:hypothetical protein